MDRSNICKCGNEKCLGWLLLHEKREELRQCFRMSYNNGHCTTEIEFKETEKSAEILRAALSEEIEAAKKELCDLEMPASLEKFLIKGTKNRLGEEENHVNAKTL